MRTTCTNSVVIFIIFLVHWIGIFIHGLINIIQNSEEPHLRIDSSFLLFIGK